MHLLSEISVFTSLQWFKGIVFFESIFQLPFFVIVVGFLAANKLHKIKTLSIIYCTHVATTMIPIYYELLFNQSLHTTKEQRQYLILTTYGPFLVVPLLFLLRLLTMSDHKPSHVVKSTTTGMKKNI